MQPYFTTPPSGDVPVGNPPEVFLDLCDILIDEGQLDVVTERFACDESVRLLDDKSDECSQYANDLVTETYILCHRSTINLLRTKEMFLARLMIAIFNAVLMGTLFLDTEEDEEGLQHRSSFFVFSIAFFYFTSLEALPIFLAEREIFQREYSRGAYRAVSYTVSQHFRIQSAVLHLHLHLHLLPAMPCTLPLFNALLLCTSLLRLSMLNLVSLLTSACFGSVVQIAAQVVTLPFMLIIGWVFVTVSWWLVNLPNLASVYFFHVLCVFTVLCAGNTFSTMISVLVPNPMTGVSRWCGGIVYCVCIVCVLCVLCVCCVCVVCVLCVCCVCVVCVLCVCCVCIVCVVWRWCGGIMCIACVVFVLCLCCVCACEGGGGWRWGSYGVGVPTYYVL